MTSHAERTYLVASRPRRGEGQGLAEYALILALIAIVAIVALIFLGGQVSKILSDGRQLGLDRPSSLAGAAGCRQ